MKSVYCPVCGMKCVSDLSLEDNGLDGQWECPEGHQFVLQIIKPKF